MRVYSLREADEEPAVQVAAGVKEEESIPKSVIIEALDEALEASEMAIDGDWQNVLIVGEAGTGKTAVVKLWARERNINLVAMLASTMDETDLGGAIIPDVDKGGDYVKRLGPTELDALDDVDEGQIGSVLFLDEFNRARSNVRGTLLTLIQDHLLLDPKAKGRRKYFEHFLFTIACINPSSGNYNTDLPLDSAEKSRFRIVKAAPDINYWLNWVLGDLDKRLAKAQSLGRDAVVEKILKRKDLITALVKGKSGNKHFKFDGAEEIDKSLNPDVHTKLTGNVESDPNGLILSPRTLTNLLYTCDGTKADFLKKWHQFCNNVDYNLVKAILENYKDKNHVGNKVMKDYDDGNKPTERKLKNKAVLAEIDAAPLAAGDEIWGQIVNKFPELDD